jgi:hypothetical protein
MPLFEVAILETPKKKKDEEEGQERLALGPVFVIAKDNQSAAISAVLDNPGLKVDRTRMLVLVRPFA